MLKHKYTFHQSKQTDLYNLTFEIVKILSKYDFMDNQYKIMPLLTFANKLAYHSNYKKMVKLIEKAQDSELMKWTEFLPVLEELELETRGKL